MRTLWKTINDITKFKKRSNLQIAELLDVAGIKFTDHIKMANLLNDYFSEIGQKMAAKIDKPSATNTNSTNPSGILFMGFLCGVIHSRLIFLNYIDCKIKPLE